MDEFEEERLPCVHRVPVYLVSEVDLGGEDEEYDAAERCHHDEHLHGDDELGITAVVFWAEQERCWVEHVEQCVWEDGPVPDGDLPVECYLRVEYRVQICVRDVVGCEVGYCDDNYADQENLQGQAVPAHASSPYPNGRP